jgi:hypothetical protein
MKNRAASMPSCKKGAGQQAPSAVLGRLLGESTNAVRSRWAATQIVMLLLEHGALAYLKTVRFERRASLGYWLEQLNVLPFQETWALQKA